MGDSPQTNGLCERANLTILNKVRMILEDTGLPKPLWSEIASSVATVMNQLPVSSHENIVSLLAILRKYTKSIGRPLFGAIAVAHTRTNNNLAPRGRPMFVVGYSTGKNGLRLCDPTKESVKVYCDYRFYESVLYRDRKVSSDQNDTTNSSAHHSQVLSLSKTIDIEKDLKFLVWRDAMAEEFESLEERNALKYVKRDGNITVFPSRSVLTREV
jgi:hypothetical protein